jgi:hypothetical protein
MGRFRSSMVGAGLLLLSTLLLLPCDSRAQVCSGFPDGGTLTGIVNTYYRGQGTNSAGATRIRVYNDGTVRGAGAAIGAGDMLLVIQMQDANINTDNGDTYGDGVASTPANGQTTLNSSGYFEYVLAEGAPSNQGYVNITGAGTNNGLLNTYRQATGPPRRMFQVIIVPRYKTATLSSTLTASPWNGNNGGVLALDITGALTLGGTVSLDGMGFRGGAGRALAGGAGAFTDYRTAATVAANGPKGEGIAGIPRYVFDGTAVTDTTLEGYANGSQARGGPANAAGGGTDGNPAANDQNSGGGGGGNGGQGGYGGNSWNSQRISGGHPGALFPYATGTGARIAMGGGGGAGSRNNSTGFQSSGGLGGGIAIIRATSVIGTGTITANGRGRDIANITPANDGGGGGGAGGTIVVVTRQGTLSGLTVQAAGGGGVDAWPTEPPGGTPGARHGPGGGGGGGVILLSSAPSSSNVSGGVSGTTTTALDPFGATAGSAGVAQTSMTFDQIPGIQSCNSNSASRATISGIRIDRSGLVEFATESQQGSTAFHVWQTSDPSGREDRQLLSWEPVASLPITTLEPVVYRVPTQPITAPYLLIEEVDARGVHRMMGPFPVSDVHLAEEFQNTEVRMAENAAMKAAARRSTKRGGLDGKPSTNGATLSSTATTSGAVPMAVKIEVSSAGTVRVPIADLVCQGMPATLETHPDRLRLTSLGLAVPFSIVAGSGNAGVLQFSADAIATDYTGRNVYLLSWRQNPFAASKVELTRSGFSPVPGMVRIERNRVYAPFAAPGADPWVWDFVATSASPQTWSFDVPRLASPGTDPVAVRIGFSGVSAHNHTVRATLNGQPVGEVTFAGKTAGSIVGQVPAGTVLGSGNRLTIEYTANLENPNDVGLVFLDLVDLGVPVQPVTAEVSVDRMTPFAYTLPPLNGVDYLIVTHGLFADGARRIAEQKRKEGLNPAVVDVEVAYNRFSSGVVEPNAIRRFLSNARTRSGGALRYVLLVGDDTFDPKNNLGRGLVSFIPSLNGMDEIFGRIPSENPYADINGDGLPELAVGRLPVSTTEQMEVMADKIIGQDTLLAAGKGTHLFAVDNPGDTDPDFRQWAEQVAETLPQQTAVKWADVAEGPAAARSTLLDSLRTGAEATHYFGHGGFGIWTDDGLLTVSDADGLAGSGVGTVLFTWACQVQWYQYHLGPTINEALLLVPNGGAVAALGPAGITEPELQRLLYTNVYLNLKKGMPLGEALRKAKVKALRSGGLARPVVEGWNLLGDPALRMNCYSVPGSGRATINR